LGNLYAPTGSGRVVNQELAVEETAHLLAMCPRKYVRNFETTVGPRSQVCDEAFAISSTHTGQVESFLEAEMLSRIPIKRNGVFTDTGRGIRNRGVAKAWESGHQTDTNGITSWLSISKFEA